MTTQGQPLCCSDAHKRKGVSSLSRWTQGVDNREMGCLVAAGLLRHHSNQVQLSGMVKGLLAPPKQSFMAFSNETSSADYSAPFYSAFTLKLPPLCQ